MSTEHPGAHDLEYGPTPPGAKYEHTDIDPNVGYKFALWLSVSMLVSVGIVYGAFYFFEGREKAASSAQVHPLAVGQLKAPPIPNLQTQPFRDIHQLRQGEDEKLASYGWVDKDGGVTHIPIDRAMEVMLQRGFPVRAGGGDGLDLVTQDSSSGRMRAPR
jgi:hypothetical protein